MIVARDVRVQSPLDASNRPRELSDDERRVLQQQAVIDMTKQIALGRLLSLGGGNMIQTGKFLALLGEHSLPLVVYGGRAYQHASGCGSWRLSSHQRIASVKNAIHQTLEQLTPRLTSERPYVET